MSPHQDMRKGGNTSVKFEVCNCNYDWVMLQITSSKVKTFLHTALLITTSYECVIIHPCYISPTDLKKQSHDIWSLVLY